MSSSVAPASIAALAAATALPTLWQPSSFKLNLRLPAGLFRVKDTQPPFPISTLLAKYSTRPLLLLHALNKTTLLDFARSIHWFTFGSIKFRTTVPSGETLSMISPLASTIPCRLPKPSICAELALVIRAILGSALSALKAISPALFAPISITANSCFSFN